MIESEVMAMSDEELRTKAAELLGWKKLEKPTRVYQAGAPGRVRWEGRSMIHE